MPSFGGPHPLGAKDVARELLEDYNLVQGDQVTSADHNRETSLVRWHTAADGPDEDAVSFLIYELDAKGRHDPGHQAVFRVRVEKL